MSKFVTYPAVTVLDDDQSLLIDSPNAGTNSITAENAGSTLLSKWAGFETFDEAVQNTIEHNQEFIDRDVAIREETAELKKKIVTTFPAKEASGAVATFESEFEDAPLKSCIVQIEPVQDLHGYDKPWSAGGGVNKFDIDNINTTVNAYGLTTSIDGDVIRLSGTYTGEASSVSYRIINHDQPIIEGAQFAVFRLDTSSIRISCRYATTLDNSIVVQMSNLTPNTDVDVRFRFMIYIGSTTPAAYSPYENICPITGWTGCEVQRTGKNLFGGLALGQAIVNAVGNSSRAYLGENTDGKFVAIVASSAVSDKQFFGTFKPNTVYTVIFRLTRYQANSSPLNSNIAFKYTDGTAQTVFFSASTATEVVTIAVSSNASKSLQSITTSYGGGTTRLFYEQSGIFEGALTEADFVPYTGQTYHIAFPASAGTVYGGYVDVTGGELVVDRAMVDLGSFHYALSTELYPRFRTDNEKPENIKLQADPTIPINGICEIFPVISAIETYRGIQGLSCQPNGGLRIYAPSYSDVDSFQTAMQGVQLVYELATPIHYPLTPQEITSLLGANNIWADTGDVSVEYLMSDVSWYVEKKLRAFQSIMAGVEDSTSASKNYSANTYLIFNNDIYRVTKAITTGETIEEGVNVTKTTVAEQLMALAQA